MSLGDRHTASVGFFAAAAIVAATAAATSHPLPGANRLLPQPASRTAAHSEKVIYSFTGGTDGASPSYLIAEGAGALYGTTPSGGPAGAGTVFELSRSGSGYTKYTLYAFKGGKDGSAPGSLILGRDGTLYGVTQSGGFGSGTLFKLHRSGSGYEHRVLYRFKGGSDGSFPTTVVASHSALYGATSAGGGGSGDGYGTIFELSSQTHRSRSDVILHAFEGTDGASPDSIVAGRGGTLYGTAASGGQPCDAFTCGVVFALHPSASGFLETVLYAFIGEPGWWPNSLIEGASGALFGTTQFGDSSLYCVVPAGPDGCGVAFELMPTTSGFTFGTLHAFMGGNTDGAYPNALVAGRHGTLYGTTRAGGNAFVGACNIVGCGTVFALTPSPSGYQETSLYVFQAGNDGSNPTSLVATGHRTLYGTTASGGGASACQGGCGTLFEVKY
jgi:hypothetical protein